MRKIDCCGDPCPDGRVVAHTRKLPLETRTVGDVTYARYGEGETCAVHRIALGPGGMVVETWAWGRWSEAESLDYAHGLDETMEVAG